MTRAALIVMGFAAGLLLAGCSQQSIAEARYPGARIFAFTSAEGGDVLQYACAPDGPGGAIEQRAAASHRYFDREIIRFADAMAKTMMADMDAGMGRAEFSAKVQRDTTAFASRTDAEMDKRFACAYLGDG